MHVPFVDLRAQHDEVRAEVDTAIAAVIDSSGFIGGERVVAFERDFAAFVQARHTVACATGTDALKLALLAAGVKPGDEVITVPHTFIATVEAMTLMGAYPVFVDIDGPTYNMSPAALAMFLEEGCRREGGQLLNRRTGRPVTALMPVHLYGLMAEMGPLMELAEKYGLTVLEDACQAHGASYRYQGEERAAGSFGAAAGWSFYPGKNLGAMGEGGAATTNDETIDRTMRMLRDHGQSERYVHTTALGWNGRLDAMQCAVLQIKLRRLADWNSCRRRAAGWYRERLADDERIVLPVTPEGSVHVYHLFVVRLPDRERVRKLLSEQGVGVGLHYPIPLHLQEAYREMGHQPGDFPESEAAASSILSLPMFPHITEEQVDYVCTTLKEALE